MPIRKPPLIRYSLATLLAAVGVVALLIAPWVNRVHRQQRAIAAVQQIGGTIGFAHERNMSRKDVPWVERWLGKEYFQVVEFVDLQGKSSTDELVREIARFDQLVQLNLCQTKITDDALPHLAGLKMLKALDLGFNPISNAALVHLAPLENLVLLDLSVTHIDDEGLSTLQHLPALYQIDLYGNAITDRGAATLAQIETLGDIDVANTLITDAGVALLAKLPNLTRLRLDQMSTGSGEELRITDAALRPLAAHPKLLDLGLIKLAVTDRGLQELARSPSLKRVSLNGCEGITKQGIQQLQSACPGLSIQR